jgi:glycerol uptake facilitator protein
VITLGWAMGVFIAVFAVGPVSGAHLNPAVTVALAVVGKFGWSQVPGYVAAQTAGAALGAFLAWLHYRPHFALTEDRNVKLGVFCTSPAIRGLKANFFSETLGTFVLVFAALSLAAPKVGLGSLDALPVALVVLGIGLGLGGTTGYAINPARDFGPRLVHALLPIPGKRDSNWRYAWLPVVAPFAGGVLAALAYRAMH